MTYTTTDFPSKAAVARAVKAGDKITVYEPGVGKPVQNGLVYLEGPHFPKPHTWYGTGMMKDGYLVSVK